MFCDNCGNEIENDVNFCPKCGMRIEFEEDKGSLNEITGEIDSNEVLKQILLSKSKEDSEENRQDDNFKEKVPKKKKKKLKVIIILIIIAVIIGGGTYEAISYKNKIENQIVKVNSDINSGNLTQANNDLETLKNMGGPFVTSDVSSLNTAIKNAQVYAGDIQEINNAIANKDTQTATNLIKELEGKDLPTNIKGELATATSNLTTLMAQIEKENLTAEKSKVEQQLQDVINSISVSSNSGYTISTMTPEELTATLNTYFKNSAKNINLAILTSDQLNSINSSKNNTDLQEQIKSNLKADYSGATAYVVGDSIDGENTLQKTTLTINNEPAYIVKYQLISDIGTDKGYSVTFISATGSVYTAQDVYNAMMNNKLSSSGYIFGYNSLLKSGKSVATSFKNAGYKSKDGTITYYPS